MGNTTTKESRQNSPGLAASDLFPPALRPRGDRGNGVAAEQRAPAGSSAHGSPSHHRRHSGHHTGSHGGHHTSHSRAKHSGYKMIVDPNETVDGGYLFPQGVYQGTQDFKVSVVREMIIRRRMAPFYKGLDSIDPGCSDEDLLALLGQPPAPEHPESAAVGAPASPPTRNADAPGPPTKTQQIWLYRNVHECPICFLVYPRLNATRCCGQDICTECFVQIKRNPPHPPYTSIESSEATDVLELVSEPSCCPYCAQPDLGIIFEAPPFEWGLPSSAAQSGSSASGSARSSPAIASQNFGDPEHAGKTATPTSQRRRRTSVPASHPSVVTVDMIRPDWEDKLASARRRLARKSAAARVLHRSALIPNDDGQESSASGGDSTAHAESQPRTATRHRRDSSLADIVEASRSMSYAQTRALERKMIEEAIQASLQQN